MTRPHPNVASPLPAPAVAPVAEWAWLCFQPLVSVQRMQWDALLCWQQSMATLNRDAWEQWAVRYGGGVPLDG